MPRVLGYKEVDDFILKKKKSFCSWCGGAEWGIHTVQPSDISAQFPGVRGAPELRSLYPIRLTQASVDRIDARVAMGTENALALVVAECLECGKMDFFNYFALNRLIDEANEANKNAAAAKAAEIHDGNNSSN